MSGEENSLDSQIGTTKYQLFIKGVRGQTYTIVVHKVCNWKLRMHQKEV